MRTGLLLTMQGVILVLVAIDVLGAGVLLTGPADAPVRLLGTLALLGIAAAFCCVLVLLRMVEQDRIFAAPTATRWVDAIIGCVLGTTAVAVGVEGAAAAALDPAVVLLLMTATVALGCGFALLVVVMRGLLRQAAALRSELAEVV